MSNSKSTILSKADKIKLKSKQKNQSSSSLIEIMDSDESSHYSKNANPIIPISIPKLFEIDDDERDAINSKSAASFKNSQIENK